MRGLMSSATGRTVEIPIKSNFREGLSVQEFLFQLTVQEKDFLIPL